jgi:hypothetical protein
MTDATYDVIRDETRRQYGFSPKSCWIAHVLADYGKTTRVAGNRLDPEKRAVPCPPHRRAALESVLRELSCIPS